MNEREYAIQPWNETLTVNQRSVREISDEEWIRLSAHAAWLD